MTCVILNQETIPPLAELWGVRGSSLMRLLQENADTRKAWQDRLLEIEEENRNNEDSNK